MGGCRASAPSKAPHCPTLPVLFAPDHSRGIRPQTVLPSCLPHSVHGVSGVEWVHGWFISRTTGGSPSRRQCGRSVAGGRAALIGSSKQSGGPLLWQYSLAALLDELNRTRLPTRLPMLNTTVQRARLFRPNSTSCGECGPRREFYPRWMALYPPGPGQNSHKINSMFSKNKSTGFSN